MPKKKFINGPAATYALLPQNGEGSGPALRWIRTDLNGAFEPFANTERVSELRSRACDGITIRDESTGADNSRLVGPAGECTEEPAPIVNYDYDRHLRVMGLRSECDIFSINSRAKGCGPFGLWNRQERAWSRDINRCRARPRTF